MEWVKSSGEKTAAALIKTGPGKLLGLMFATDGMNPITVSVYDNTSAAGDELIPTLTITTSATDRMRQIDFSKPIIFNKGLYVNATVGGGTFAYSAYYK